MSTSFTPSTDLVLNTKLPAKESLFTTFDKGHFVKPSQFTQPVKAASFAGCYTEMFAAAPLDLDYDEPNTVVETELELVQSTGCVHQIEVTVLTSNASKGTEVDDRVIPTKRSAA